MSFRISYWVLPIISGLVWLGTLLGLLLDWVINHDKRRYPSMSENASIPYISNIGAHKLKPLFITGCVLTTIFLDLSFAADRWLRHSGRLLPNTTRGEKILKSLTIAFAVVGTVGLILLSIFDTYRHNKLHHIFLGLFIGGYLVSAIFVCWEYRLLRTGNREQPIFRTSFLLKLFFIVVELALCIAFGVCSRTKSYNKAAVLEWVIAAVFSFYVFSFVIDLWPAMHTKHVVAVPARGRSLRGTRGKMRRFVGGKREPSPLEMEEARIAEPERARFNGYY